MKLPSDLTRGNEESGTRYSQDIHSEWSAS